LHNGERKHSRLLGRSYFIRTFGCQMNKSDSERVAGMLDALGAEPALRQEDADLIVFMTCCVREAADERLYGQVASLKNSGALVAVGGCIGQRDAAELARKMPHIGVVFGTHNIASLPGLIEEALESKAPVVEVISNKAAAANEQPAPDLALPARREQTWHAWLPIIAGCNNFCSYCVVPHVRGRERSQPFEALVDEAQRLVADGVREITLLGQNVNSYGRDLYGQPRFAELLYALGEVGIERLRFATSHPKDLFPLTIQAFADVPALMPALHLPAQSGSNRILKLMNRRYTAEQYLGLVEQVRAACKTAGKEPVAFSTDIIVGYPGETAEDFEQTLALVRAVGYAQAFTFLYSPREGTPAASLPDTTPREDIQERFDQLVEAVQQSAWCFNQHFLATELPVLFEGASKRDARQLAGRGPGNQTVHVPLPDGAEASDVAGRILPVQITEARTWYLSGSLS
jgi:tRNA-2-methylthio-N6-dimethylallyladenosine synthase